jgi:hypothetical protein
MKTDIKSLLEFAGVDTTQGKAKELVESEEAITAAYALNDEGEAEIETPESPMWKNTMGTLQYAEPTTWEEADKHIKEWIAADLKRFGHDDAHAVADAAKANKLWKNFVRKYKTPRSKVMKFHDEYAVIFVK